MTDQDLIAAFLAKNTVTHIDDGVRTTTDRQLKRRCGYEPEKVYVYECMLLDECGDPFCVHERATSKSQCREKLAEQYPESRVESVEHLGAREERIQQELQRRLNDDEWDLY